MLVPHLLKIYFGLGLPSSVLEIVSSQRLKARIFELGQPCGPRLHCTPNLQLQKRQTCVVNLWYFKLFILPDQLMIKVKKWKVYYQVADIHELENSSLRRIIKSFLESSNLFFIIWYLSLIFFLICYKSIVFASLPTCTYFFPGAFKLLSFKRGNVNF